MKYYKLLTFTLLFCLSACGGEKKDTDTTQDSVETVLPDEANEVTIMTLKKTEFNHELISGTRYFPAHEQNSASQGCPRESEA